MAGVGSKYPLASNTTKVFSTLEECPHTFLKEFCEFVAGEDVSRYVNYIVQCLISDANAWYRAVGRIAVSWGEFVEGFLDEFDRTRVQSRIISRLFSKRSMPDDAPCHSPRASEVSASVQD